MPVFMAPKVGKNLETKPVRMEGFEEEGPFAEHFDILRYYEEATDDAARKAATTTITKGNGQLVKEEFDRNRYMAEVLKAQLKGWRLIAPYCPPDMDEKEFAERTEAHPDTGDQRWWKFTPANVASLPWDVTTFLFGEIQRCGGAVATRPLIVTTDSGQRLDFRGSHAGVEQRAEPALPDPV